MPAIIRKLVTILDETRREMRRDLATPIRRVVCCAVIENPFAGRYTEDLVGADRPGRGTRRAAGGARHRRARHPGRPGAELRQGRGGGRGGGAGTCRRTAAPEDGRAGAGGAGEGAGADPLGQEVGRAGDRDRRAARAQGCRLRAQPFRRDRGAGAGCAAGATRSWSAWRSPMAAGRCRGSAG